MELTRIPVFALSNVSLWIVRLHVSIQNMAKLLRNLPDAKIFRGDLEVLVVVDEFHELFERHFAGRCDSQALVSPGSPHVGELLAPNEVQLHVVLAAAFAHDLAFVDVLTWIDEEDAAILEPVDFVGPCLAHFR